MMRVLLCAVLLMGVGGAYADNEWMYQPPARSVVYRLNVDVADADMAWMRPPPARSVGLPFGHGFVDGARGWLQQGSRSD